MFSQNVRFHMGTYPSTDGYDKFYYYSKFGLNMKSLHMS